LMRLEVFERIVAVPNGQGDGLISLRYEPGTSLTE
jgi:hypothetical protein